MPTPRKIDPATFHRLCREGKSQKELAAHFKVTPSAICQFSKQHKQATNKAIVLREAHRLAKSDLDLIEKTCMQERRLMAVAELSWKIATGDPNALKMAEQIRKLLPKTQFLDPLKLYLSAIGQVSELIKIKKSLMESLFDIQHAAAFQQEVLEILAGSSPEVRKKVIRRLKENKALSASLRVPRAS